MEIREARAPDNEELQSLQARCPQGTSLVISAVNTPDFFARAQAYEQARVFVAVEGGEIVSSAACAIRDGLVGGELRRVGYEFQYFTAPERRGRGVARTLRHHIEDYLRQQGVALSYAFVVEGNSASAHLFEAQGFRPSRDIRAAVVLAYRPVRVPAHGSIRSARAADYPAVAELLNRTWGRHELYEPISTRGLAELVERLPEFDPADLWVLEEDGEVVACLGGWDWSRITRVTVEALPLRLRVLGVALDAARRFRPVPLVRAGETMRQWCAPIAAYRDPRDFGVLLRYATNQTLERGGDQR
jgi:L-amino acid N-acyltransferase YncA